MLELINIMHKKSRSKEGPMIKILKILVVGSLSLACPALWALGSHVVWSAQKILMATVVLALVGFAIYL
jgi:hypothetical protein